MAGRLRGLKVIVVPQGEEGAANFLRINQAVLVGDCYPRTLELLSDAGFAAQGLPIGEIRKLDAGLSCMSLRWHAQD